MQRTLFLLNVNRSRLFLFVQNPKSIQVFLQRTLIDVFLQRTLIDVDADNNQNTGI